MRTFVVTLLMSAWTLFYLSPLIGSMFDLTMWMFSSPLRLMEADKYGPAIAWTLFGFYPWLGGFAILCEFERP